MSEEELELLDYTFSLAIGECFSDEIDDICKLQEKVINQDNIIKEVRELVENGNDFKSIYFKKDKEDLWKVILSDEIKEKYLEILDKGSEMKND